MANTTEYPDYAVALISDTHFDEGPWSRYRGALPQDPNSLAAHDFNRNLIMWQDLLPRLLTASASIITADTDFVFHLGDITQGHAENARGLTQMLQNGWTQVTNAYGATPVYLLVGNHDVLAPDGVAAYDAWSRRPRCRAFRKGPDAWILVDSDRPPSLGELKKLFRQAEGARWTFFLSHRPVFPFAVGLDFLYGKDTQDDCRQELRRLLAERQAIVLSAHVHSLIHATFDFPEGRVTQFVINSLWEKPELANLAFHAISRHKWCTKAAHVGAEQRAAFTRFTDEFRPYLTSYRQTHAAGHFRLKVSDTDVRLELYGGDATDPSETVILADQKRARPTKLRILRKIADFLRRGLSRPRTVTSR